MPVVNDIAAVHANQSLNADEKREQIYGIKTTALIDVILNGKPAPQPVQPLLGRSINQKDFTFRINSAQATPENSLLLNVTFTKPPAPPVIRLITIVNPPVLPTQATRSGNEKQDLIQAVSEMLEGFV